MYLTENEVLGYFPDLNDRLESGKVTEVMIKQWIKDASSIIDLYLSKRYKVPLSKQCPLIITLSKELFEYFDCKNRYTPSFAGEAEAEKFLEKRYDRVIKLLEKIASGEFALFDEDGSYITPDPKKVVVPWSNNMDSEPIFKITKEAIDLEVPEGYAGEE